MKSNFESLSGADDQVNNSSISFKYKSGVDSAVSKNAKTIARAQSFRDEEQNRKREELQRRIEETRKKLQNVSSIRRKLAKVLTIHGRKSSVVMLGAVYTCTNPCTSPVRFHPQFAGRADKDPILHLTPITTVCVQLFSKKE
jgi:hypothetical protein